MSFEIWDRKVKIYLENSVVSALGRNDTPQETNALLNILESFKSGKYDVYTSEVTAKEIEKYRGDKKPIIEAIYKLLKNVPYIESQKLLGIHSSGDRYTWIAYPMIEDDPIWSKLRSMGIDATDAHHLMLAIRANCDIFLTCDGRLRRKASQIEAEFKIHVMKPSELNGASSKAP